MVTIPAGTFQMGCNYNDTEKPIPAGAFQMGCNYNDTEKPNHSVTFNRPFAIGMYPVMFAEYADYIKQTGVRKPIDKGWGRGKRPVIDVSWDDAVTYAEWLANQTGKQYRLPSEAEWEYAARAGIEGDYFWGDSKIEDYAWFEDNSGGKTHPVGEKEPNAFGLYDMSGNVWEWVQDCWHRDFQNAPDDGTAWEQANGGNCSMRVLRGGSWNFESLYLRSAYRVWNTLEFSDNEVGFRLAQDLP